MLITVKCISVLPSKENVIYTLQEEKDSQRGPFDSGIPPTPGRNIHSPAAYLFTGPLTPSCVMRGTLCSTNLGLQSVHGHFLKLRSLNENILSINHEFSMSEQLHKD